MGAAARQAEDDVKMGDFSRGDVVRHGADPDVSALLVSFDEEVASRGPHTASAPVMIEKLRVDRT